MIQKSRPKALPVQTVEAAGQEDPLQASDAGRLLASAIHDMHQADDREEDRYRRAKDKIRKQIHEVTRSAEEADASIGASPDALRWAMLYVIGDIAAVESLEYLKRYALRPVPRDDEPGCEKIKVSSELVYRCTAVDGIANLFEIAPDVAEHALFEIIEGQEATSVRRAVASHILRRYPDRKDTIARLLSKDQLFILELKRPQVGELDQPNPALTRRRQRQERLGKGGTPPMPTRSSERPRVHQVEHVDNPSRSDKEE